MILAAPMRRISWSGWRARFSIASSLTGPLNRCSTGMEASLAMVSPEMSWTLPSGPAAGVIDSNASSASTPQGRSGSLYSCTYGVFGAPVMRSVFRGMV